MSRIRLLPIDWRSCRTICHIRLHPCGKSEADLATSGAYGAKRERDVDVVRQLASADATPPRHSAESVEFASHGQHMPNKHHGLARFVPVGGTDCRNRLDAPIFDAVLTTLPVK